MQEDMDMPSIDIDDEHWDAFEQRAEEKGFDTTEEYVQHVLRQVYEKLQRQNKETYSEEDEEKVRDRLRNLGYMD